MHTTRCKVAFNNSRCTFLAVRASWQNFHKVGRQENGSLPWRHLYALQCWVHAGPMSSEFLSFHCTNIFSNSTHNWNQLKKADVNWLSVYRKFLHPQTFRFQATSSHTQGNFLINTTILQPRSPAGSKISRHLLKINSQKDSNDIRPHCKYLLVLYTAIFTSTPSTCRQRGHPKEDTSTSLLTPLPSPRDCNSRKRYKVHPDGATSPWNITTAQLWPSKLQLRMLVDFWCVLIAALRCNTKLTLRIFYCTHSTTVHIWDSNRDARWIMKQGFC